MSSYDKLPVQRWAAPYSPVGLSASQQGVPRAVGSVSCRQIYLRSYTFSRKESVQEKTKKCWERLREGVKNRKLFGKRSSSRVNSDEEKSTINGDRKSLWRAGDRMPGDALLLTLRRLMSCTANVDLAD